MADLIFNGTTLAWDDDVYFNGTALTVGKKIYFNGTEVWKKHPYEPGQVVFTYSWSNGSNISNFQSSYVNVYTAAFSSGSFTQGSGSPDSRYTFTLADGFRVSYYNQSEYGTDSDGSGSGNTGGTYVIYVGNTVSGLTDSTYGFSIPGSGNGGSSFKVLYEG